MKNSFCVLLAAVIVASCSSVPENFVKVDGGTFMKGWTEKERALYKVNYGKDEDPLAPKEMSVETFYISKYEVTVGLWYEVMGFPRKSLMRNGQKSLIVPSWASLGSRR